MSSHLLARFPISTPPLSVMLRDLCNPSAADLARALHAGERTARRWIADDHAPHSVMLSVFWATTWGQQWLDADQHNRLVSQMNLAAALARELDQARAALAMATATDTPKTEVAPRLPDAPRLLYSVR